MPCRQYLSEHYSRISNVNRFLSFMPAAPRIVRIDRAVLPCFPITLPRSLGATLSSSTVVCSPSIAVTETSSGLSTRALAICSISSFIAASHFHFNVLKRNVSLNECESRAEREPESSTSTDVISQSPFYGECCVRSPKARHPSTASTAPVPG